VTIGDVFTLRIPTELDYLAPADTVRTEIHEGIVFTSANSDNLTIVMVDVSGRNSVRKVVVVVTARAI